uniref:Uncharacterized protein n=1 Tax=Oryza punctata TaxID=4537 RepID=A0A0E0JTE8_ORYPU
MDRVEHHAPLCPAARVVSAQADVQRRRLSWCWYSTSVVVSCKPSLASGAHKYCNNRVGPTNCRRHCRQGAKPKLPCS